MAEPLGQKFGSWTVVDSSPDKKRRISVRCDCGFETRVRNHDVYKGKSRMCKSCASTITRISHGGAGDRSKTSFEYNTWVHMLQRCYNPRNKSYKDYGGRGIQVCDMWKASFEAFYMCLGPRPAPEYTIERLDSNGNYEPTNCTWATRQEQVLNKRDNVNLTIEGETKTVSQWALAPKCTVTHFVIYKRLVRGWEPKEAVFAPSGSKRGQYV